MDERNRLFEANLPAIECAIARVCREARLEGANAEDFASSVRLALLADDCAILRKFEGRSSMPTYLTIVVRRLFYDERRAAGRWYASAEAQRHGPAAVLFERLTMHERRTFRDAADLVQRDHPDVSLAELEQLAAVLPQRTVRPLIVPVEDEHAERFASGSSAGDLVDSLDVQRRSIQANDAVRVAMAMMTAEDRVILRLRFTANASIAQIARSLNLEQRPLYRRIESLLAAIRRALEAAGVDAASVDDLIGVPEETLDFGLERKNGDMHPSPQEEGR
jgi:RNA polymerase sigma factor (sigma-70 family)